MSDTRDRPTDDDDPITVMVVEPDVFARMVIADYLRNCGYKVVEGATAADVFAVVNADGGIDIILAEVQLPDGVDGFTLARQIRDSHPGIDIILVSGEANAAHKAGDLCDDAPMKKPYHPQDVVRRINILRQRERASKNS
jgi:DNA-binding response OmpR family regulator